MEEIASVYARSLFEVAQEQDKLDTVRDQLGEFADAMHESRELQVFLFSPYFSTKEKVEGLDKAVSGADETIVNLVKLLIEKHRMPAIFRVRAEFDELRRSIGQVDRQGVRLVRGQEGVHVIQEERALVERAR